jgi:hypothetical protein
MKKSTFLENPVLVGFHFFVLRFQRRTQFFFLTHRFQKNLPGFSKPSRSFSTTQGVINNSWVDKKNPFVSKCHFVGINNWLDIKTTKAVLF